MNRILLLLLCMGIYQFHSAQVNEATLQGRWFNPDLVPSLAHDNTYNEVWGLAVNDHEIAVIGSTAGTHFIDVTDPGNPEEIHFVAGRAVGPQIIHRDYHDYAGYLYCVADEGASTLQIIDISQLPASIEVVYDSRDYFQRSHNIFIDTATARLYALINNGDKVPFAPMRIFDISDPVDPVPLKAYNSFGGYNISQVHDAFVRNDTAYLNFGPKGLGIINFADIENPEMLAILEPMDYPDAGYNHSGWLTPDGNHYYMADENFDTDIKVLDVSHLPEITIPTTFNAGNENPFSIPHNQIVHNGFLYVSYYFDGLQIYDITDPETPERVIYYQTSSREHMPAYQGAWGVYPFLPSGNILVSDMQEGLFVVRHPEISDVKEVKHHPLTLYPNPSEGRFTIQIPEEASFQGQVEIIDLLGQKVYSRWISLEKWEAFAPSLSLQAATYIVRLQSADKVWTGEIVISH